MWLAAPPRFNLHWVGKQSAMPPYLLRAIYQTAGSGLSDGRAVFGSWIGSEMLLYDFAKKPRGMRGPEAAVKSGCRLHACGVLIFVGPFRNHRVDA